jgi:hypothetical protein
MNQEATSEPNDDKKRMAYMILGIAAVLIGISVWLGGRKGDKDRFSYDNLRKMIFGEDRG